MHAIDRIDGAEDDVCQVRQVIASSRSDSRRIGAAPRQRDLADAIRRGARPAPLPHVPDLPGTEMRNLHDSLRPGRTTLSGTAYIRGLACRRAYGMQPAMKVK
jgi:hypothetical protein